MKHRLRKTKKKPELIIFQEYYGNAAPIKSILDENIKIIQDLLGHPSDLSVREFYLGANASHRAALFCIEGLVNTTQINDSVLKELMFEIRQTELDLIQNKKMIDLVMDHALPINAIKRAGDYKTACERLLKGDSLLFFENTNECLVMDTKGWIDRGIDEPKAETVIRGARDSFNESLRTNTMLVRRRIKDINLRVISREVGEITKTNLEVLYIEGLAQEKVVTEVLRRLDSIKIDGILESGYIEELIHDEPYSIFPTMYSTERPDIVAGNLLEGRVAILTDGTPFALIVPTLFVQFFQSVEDYYQRSYFSSFIRLIRYLAFILALFTPAVYIAIVTYHHALLPTSLLVSISNQRKAVPFPTIVEVLIMEITFEILREAGIRMPRAIGSAISIVGTLVLGEAAVSAGIVSNFMVIIVSITAISSLIVPEYNFANPIRILRFIFIILAATLGFFGLSIGLTFLIIHLVSLRSFGVPYMYPFAPFDFKALKDTVIRAPISMMKTRPKILTNENVQRQKEEVK